MNVSVGKTLNVFVPEIKKAQAYNENKIANSSVKYATVPFTAYRSYVNFTGNAPQITKATVVTTDAEDIVLEKTKNGGYIVEPETQTELIYGNDATKFLNKTNKFEYDTQITFPKKATGTLFIDGKEIKIKENSTVLLNKGTDAKVSVDKGYPQILMTKNDYAWYKKHSNDLHQEQSLMDKFKELISKNSHTYNGEFKSNLFSNDENKNNALVEKLKNTGLVKDERSGYLRFKQYPVWKYQKEQLKNKGFNDEEIETIKPVYEQVRQTRQDTKLTIKGKPNGMSQETINKLKNCAILFDSKNHLEDIYWKTNFESEQHLREALNDNGIHDIEQETVVTAWKMNNKIGYDVTGLKFINDNAAVYCLDDKVNNWSMEKSCWLTNSTELSCRKNDAPTIGTSIVQADKNEPTPMSKLRKGEHLHTHPGTKDKSQTELYVVTSGSAALTVVRNGVPQIKVLREGEMAVIPPNTPHCVNSVMGEYEQVVSQIPSAFQYGLSFKENYELPQGYTEEALEEQARKELLACAK